MHLLNDQSEKLFQALADHTRIRILRLFATINEEACLCELVDSLLEPEYGLSRHIKILKNSGLLTARKEGRWVYHRLVTGVPHLEALGQTVKVLPDPNDIFKKDLANFKKRLCLRENGRCQIGIQSEHFMEKVKLRGARK